MHTEYASMAEKLIEKFISTYQDKVEKDLAQTLCFGFMIYLYRSIEFVRLAGLMIPNFPSKDLEALPSIRPPTFNPGLNFALEKLAKKLVRYARKMARISHPGAPLTLCSSATGKSILISRVLNSGLP